MAKIYSEADDGSIIELSNWGVGGAENPDQAMVGRRLTDEEMQLYHELKQRDCSDSGIWLEMHPAWPRGNGNEILRPLKREEVKSENTMRVPLRQITTGMLITIIERQCNQPLENLKKMRRTELEAMAEAVLKRNYITIDLDRP